MWEDLKQLYKYREMLNNMVRKDLRTRYKGSILGFLWTFINPLLQLIVYSIVFSTIMRVDVENYPMFLFVTLLPWIFFQTSMQVGAGSIIANKDLVKKIYFPRGVIPIAVVSSGLMNLLFGFVVVIPCLFIFKIYLNFSVIALPLVILVEYIITLGIAILFSALNVYFRDLEHILGIVTMAWTYLTPIFFPVEMVPKGYLTLFFLNPMTPIINSYRDILYYGRFPDFEILILSAMIGMLILIFSYNVFKKLERNFAEEI